MSRYYKRYHKRNGVCGKSGVIDVFIGEGEDIRLVLSRVWVNDYSFTLDALALKPSDFCNLGVISVKQSGGHDGIA